MLALGPARVIVTCQQEAGPIESADTVIRALPFTICRPGFENEIRTPAKRGGPQGQEETKPFREKDHAVCSRSRTFRFRRGGGRLRNRRASLRRRARGRCGTRRRARMLRPMDGQDQILQVAREEAALSHRARQRLYRQHLAHPDDPDRESLCRPARRRGEAQGVQGRLDRRGRRRADRRGQQFHRFRLRRDRRRTPRTRRPSSR